MSETDASEFDPETGEIVEKPGPAIGPAEEVEVSPEKAEVDVKAPKKPSPKKGETQKPSPAAGKKPPAEKPAAKAKKEPVPDGEKLGGQNHPTLDADQDTRDKLKKLTDRIIEAEDEKEHVAGQIKLVYQEAKALGFDTKILRKVVREMKRNEADRQEEFRLMEMYLNAVGIFW